MPGGNQQRGRSGTQDVSGAVAFGLAAREAVDGLRGMPQLTALRDRLIAGVRADVEKAFGDSIDSILGNQYVQVAIQAIPVQWNFNYGDGSAPRVSTTPGGPQREFNQQTSENSKATPEGKDSAAAPGRKPR